MLGNTSTRRSSGENSMGLPFSGTVIRCFVVVSEMIQPFPRSGRWRGQGLAHNTGIGRQHDEVAGPRATWNDGTPALGLQRHELQLAHLIGLHTCRLGTQRHRVAMCRECDRAAVMALLQREVEGHRVIGYRSCLLY